MQNTSYFAHNLPILRRRRGYTQETLAEALDVSRQAVGKWEAGAALPEAATLLTLSDVLDCTLDELMKVELPDDFGRRAPVTEPLAETEQVVPEVGPFEVYEEHMERFALFNGFAVLLIMVSVGQFLGVALRAGGRWAVLSLGAMVVLIGVAVGMFVYAGIDHWRFRRDFPGLPGGGKPNPTAQFLQRFQVGLPLAVGALVADGGGMVLLGGVYWYRWLIFLIFFVVLGISVGILVYLGVKRTAYARRR